MDINPSTPPPDSNPDVYAHFTVAPPEDNRYTSATVRMHTATQSLPPRSPPAVMETTLAPSRFVAPTRLRSKTTMQDGPCAYTVDLLQIFYMQAYCKVLKYR